MFVAGPLSSSVDRSQGFTVTWTGGNPGGYGTSTTLPIGLTAGFTCMSTVDAHQFTVPSYVLSGIPAGTGGVNLQTGAYSTFTATGLDTRLALDGISYQAGSNTFQ